MRYKKHNIKKFLFEVLFTWYTSTVLKLLFRRDFVYIANLTVANQLNFNVIYSVLSPGQQ